MTNTLLLVLIGAFIGWNLPQPAWAKWLQAKGVSLFNRIKSKFSSKKNSETEMKKTKKTKTTKKTEKKEVTKPVEEAPKPARSRPRAF
jgi:hypothetical protein